MKHNTQRYFLLTAFIIAFALSVFESVPIIYYQITGNVKENVPIFFDKLHSFDFIFIYGITLLSNISAFILAYIFIQPFKKLKRSRKWWLGSALIIIVFLLYTPMIQYINQDAHFFSFNLARTFMVCFIAASYTLISRASHMNQMYELENEILKKENLQSQLEALKNDLSPHFLFNSLNALQTLIRDNPELANRYVNHLSIVLRNSLQNNHNKCVTLADEITLAHSYIFLMEMRYGSNMIIDIDVPEKYCSCLIPPFSIQGLIENAIKHNEISKRNPLKIHIVAKADSICVKNNIQLKLTPETSMGIGLNNLVKRYLLLSEKDIFISNSNNQFEVCIPYIESNKT